MLGEAATDEALAAWGEAYWFLADVLISREAQLYADAPRPLQSNEAAAVGA